MRICTTQTGVAFGSVFSASSTYASSQLSHTAMPEDALHSVTAHFISSTLLWVTFAWMTQTVVFVTVMPLSTASILFARLKANRTSTVMLDILLTSLHSHMHCANLSAFIQTTRLICSENLLGLLRLFHSCPSNLRLVSSPARHSPPLQHTPRERTPATNPLFSSCLWPSQSLDAAPVWCYVHELNS